MRDRLSGRLHPGFVAVAATVLGMLVIGAAVIGLAVHFVGREERQHQSEQSKERTAEAMRQELAQKVVLAGERKAEKIVIGSERAGCERSAANLTQNMNTWYRVDHADFAVAAEPSTTPDSARIRLLEAIGIDREQNAVAVRLDYHYAGRLLSAHWAHTAREAKFSCVKAFPLPFSSTGGSSYASSPRSIRRVLAPVVLRLRRFPAEVFGSIAWR